MNISPDDFKKIGIDSSAIQSKKEQTTYKIKYVTRYVRQWAIVEAGRKTISQINFIDCMCNAGIYKDGDFCTGMEVINIFKFLLFLTVPLIILIKLFILSSRKSFRKTTNFFDAYRES